MKQIRIQGLAQKINRIVLVSAAAAVASFAGTAASAQIVTNGFFQEGISSNSDYAGYASTTTSFPGFTANTSTNYGVDGYGTYDPLRNRVDTQFAPGGYVASATTDPVDFAFLQGPGVTLTQDLPNLNRLSVYQVSFVAGTRNGNSNATGEVSIGGALLPANASSAGTPFKAYSFDFDTGLSLGGYVLTLSNTTNGTLYGTDQTVDFSDLVITRVGNLDGQTIPEPGTYALLGLGVLGLLLTSRRRMMNSQTKSSMA